MHNNHANLDALVLAGVVTAPSSRDLLPTFLNLALAILEIMQLAYPCISYQEDELFPETANLWNLESLYVDLTKQKQNKTKREAKLTPIERACLRGLLSGYSPRKIAAALNWTYGSISVELTKSLYRYVEALTGRQQNALNNWRDISRWLEAAGYKTPIHRQNWGEAPDISVFYGRTGELDTLKRWIGKQKCRLVGILGMVGTGKTALAVKLAKEMQSEFDLIIWRSLHNAPLLKQLLADLIQFLSNQQPCHLPEDTNVLISHFINCLGQRRSLVVFDEFQTLMRSYTIAGQYRKGYEDYGELLREVGLKQHQSCLVFNSRENPLEMELLEKNNLFICSLKLRGLPKKEAGKILAVNSLLVEEKEEEKIITRYQGNPLALNLVATIIQDFFNGSASQFLSWNTVIIPDPLRVILIQQLNRLDESEREIMSYLAINPKPVSLEQLRNAIQLGSASKLINILKSLERRSIIEKITERSQTAFTLEPLVRGCLLVD